MAKTEMAKAAGEISGNVKMHAVAQCINGSSQQYGSSSSSSGSQRNVTAKISCAICKISAAMAKSSAGENHGKPSQCESGLGGSAAARSH
jgi:hypothetical protein